MTAKHVTAELLRAKGPVFLAEVRKEILEQVPGVDTVETAAIEAFRALADIYGDDNLIVGSAHDGVLNFDWQE